MPVHALDGAVLVGDAGIVAARLHAIVGTQGIVAPGQVLTGVAIQIAEGSGEAVAAMLTWSTTERPESVLQPLGERDIALAAEHHVGMLEAGIGEPEVIEPVIERLTGDGDGKIGHVGEVGQAHASGLVHLAEDDLLLGAMCLLASGLWLFSRGDLEGISCRECGALRRLVPQNALLCAYRPC